MGPEFIPELDNQRRKMGPLKPGTDAEVKILKPAPRIKKRKWNIPPPRDRVDATYRGDLVVVDDELFLDRQKICNVKDLKKNLKKLGNSIIKSYLKS